MEKIRQKKGKAASIFKLKDKIVGEEKESPESVAIIHPVTKIKLFNHDEILEAAVDYVHNLLKDNEPKDDFIKEISIRNKIHDLRMLENLENDDENHFTEDDFKNILDHLQKKSKQKGK